MKKYFCNPINFTYQYQFNQKEGGFSLNREAADPSMILFRGKYYLFPSMTRGFLVSEDMASWKLRPLTGVPLYDYAPDVRAIGDWMYFCASRQGEICDFYRTKDPESGVFEKLPGTFDFWDPNLFLDDDGRLYFYWGCSNMTPIWGVELNPETMERIGEPVALIDNHKTEYGYERTGEEHHYDPSSSPIAQILRERIAKASGCRPEDVTDVTPAIEAAPESYRPLLRAALSDNPYIEGAWMTKHDGRYYLQYAAPGTQYNIYNDGVCVSESPLGPFTACPNNPYSYSPGGFLPGAGHGSTMEDRQGNWWHASTVARRLRRGRGAVLQPALRRLAPVRHRGEERPLGGPGVDALKLREDRHRQQLRLPGKGRLPCGGRERADLVESRRGGCRPLASGRPGPLLQGTCGADQFRG